MAQQSDEPIACADAPASSAASVVDSGIDAGPSYDQDNYGHHLLQAQTESDEVSTDEG